MWSVRHASLLRKEIRLTASQTELQNVHYTINKHHVRGLFVSY